jgi:hypothetical protein
MMKERRKKKEERRKKEEGKKGNKETKTRWLSKSPSERRDGDGMGSMTHTFGHFIDIM